MNLNWFKKRENLGVIFISMVILVLHLILINDVNSPMFDEHHYIPEAIAIIDGEKLDNLEHPPLGKMLLADSIRLCGDNTYGWRLFSSLFGVASIILFYLICQELTRFKYLPLVATAIFAFENHHFVQSSIAMLDVFTVTFMMGAFLLYLRGMFIAAGLVLALSALAKLSGILGGIIILGHWLITQRKPWTDGIKFFVTSVLTFVLLMPFLDYFASGEFEWPWDRINFMREQLASVTFSSSEHDQRSYPWEWLISHKPMCFWYKPTFWGSPSWTLWIMIIPSIWFAVYGAIKRSSWALFAVIWFAATYVSWIPTVLISDRISYKFYFYPTIGAICLALAFAIHKIWLASNNRENTLDKWAIRIPVILFFIAHLAAFVIMSPFCDWWWTTECG